MRHRTAASAGWLRARTWAALAVVGAGLATAGWLPARDDSAAAASAPLADELIGEPVRRLGGQPFGFTLNLAADRAGPAPMLADYLRVTGLDTTASAAWKAYTVYRAGQVVSYRGASYRVAEAHTALPGWEPPALPNLFVAI